MSTPRWREYTIAVWIILAVITGLILWFGWPVYKSSNSRYPVLLDHIYNWAT